MEGCWHVWRIWQLAYNKRIVCVKCHKSYSERELNKIQYRAVKGLPQ